MIGNVCPRLCPKKRLGTYGNQIQIHFRVSTERKAAVGPYPELTSVQGLQKVVRGDDIACTEEDKYNFSSKLGASPETPTKFEADPFSVQPFMAPTAWLRESFVKFRHLCLAFNLTLAYRALFVGKAGRHSLGGCRLFRTSEQVDR